MPSESRERQLELRENRTLHSESASVEARDGMNDFVNRQSARNNDLKAGARSGITGDFGRPIIHESSNNTSEPTRDSRQPAQLERGAGVCATRERFDENFENALRNHNYRDALDTLTAERRCQRISSQEFDQRLAHVYARLYIERGGDAQALHNLSPQERQSLHNAMNLVNSESPDGEAAQRWRVIHELSQREWRQNINRRRH